MISRLVGAQKLARLSMKINEIDIKIIPDSKGKDTLEAEMESGGIRITASVPAGESTGRNETKVIVPKAALEKASWVKTQMKNQDFITLEQFDGFLNTLDGTPDKSNLGANFILSLSLAFTKLLAKQSNLEVWQLIAKISGSKPGLPLCFFNVIEGGVHTTDSLPFQEYWFIPKTNSPKEALDKCLSLLKFLGEKIQAKYGEVKMGSEGGFTVPSKDAEDGLKILQEVIKERGLDTNLGLDVAASTLFENGSYRMGEKIMSNNDLLSYYQLLTTNYQLFAIEDPFAEEDWDGFAKITKSLGSATWIVGDDLTTTNPKTIKMAAEKEAVNAVIIKTTQIGTVSETIQAANLAKSFGWKIIVANRGEETMDDFIADLAVGLGAAGLKSGCPLQKERLVKYERLLEIESRIKN